MKIDSFEQFENTPLGKEFLNRVNNTKDEEDIFELPISNWNKLIELLSDVFDNLDTFTNVSIINFEEFIGECGDFYQQYLIDLNQNDLIKYNTETKLLEIITKIALISDKLNNYKEQQSKLKTELKAFVQDKSVNLEERWKILVSCLELGDKTYYTLNNCPSYINNEEYLNRGSDYTVKELYEDGNLDIEEKINFQKECCDNFITYMKYDW